VGASGLRTSAGTRSMKLRKRKKCRNWKAFWCLHQSRHDGFGYDAKELPFGLEIIEVRIALRAAVRTRLYGGCIRRCIQPSLSVNRVWLGGKPRVE
jgi:hypothetical protein